MEEDPEKRIAELESRLSDATWTAGEDRVRPGQVSAGQYGGFPPPVDWQQPSAQSALGYGSVRRRRPMLLLLLVPAIVLLVTAGVVLFAGTTGLNPFSSGPRKLLQGDGLSGLISQMREEFGDTMGYELLVFEDHAVLYRENPDNERTLQGYIYRAGGWSDWTTTSKNSAFDPANVDLSAFDAAAVTATLAAAPQTLDLTDGPSSWLRVAGRSGESLDLRIHVSTEAESGYMEINPDGTVKKLYPPT